MIVFSTLNQRTDRRYLQCILWVCGHVACCGHTALEKYGMGKLSTLLGHDLSLDKSLR